jgi:hypothetical protein
MNQGLGNTEAAGKGTHITKNKIEKKILSKELNLLQRR